MDLITLSGRKSKLGQPKFQFSLFSMAGLPEMIRVNPRELSDIDAGIWTLYWINKFYPGVTWGEIYGATNPKLSGILDWVKEPVSDLGSWLGKGISDAGDKIGEWSGDAIRLITDEEVREGIAQYSTAYATGGTSEGIKGFLSQLGNVVSGDSKADLLAALGRNTKLAAAPQLISGIDNKVLYIGGGLLLVLLILTR